MSGAATIEVAGQLRLEAERAWPEPASLRDSTRAAVLDNPQDWDRLSADGTWIARPMWDLAAPELAERGLSQEGLALAARGYRLELWLWLMGERTWPHCVQGLIGRAERRVSSRPIDDSGTRS